MKVILSRKGFDSTAGGRPSPILPDGSQSLRNRLTELAGQLAPDHGAQLGEQLAVLIDGCDTSAARLGPDGPAASGLELARTLVTSA